MTADACLSVGRQVGADAAIPDEHDPFSKRTPPIFLVGLCQATSRWNRSSECCVRCAAREARFERSKGSKTRAQNICSLVLRVFWCDNAFMRLQSQLRIAQSDQLSQRRKPGTFGQQRVSPCSSNLLPTLPGTHIPAMWSNLGPMQSHCGCTLECPHAERSLSQASPLQA